MAKTKDSLSALLRGVLVTQPPQLPFRSAADRNRVGVSARIPEELKEDLQKTAKERGISFSDVVTHFLLWANSEWKKLDTTKK